MAAHRYWRLVGIAVYGLGALELSEARLYEHASLADLGATLTSSIAPASGALVDLQDESAAGVVSWNLGQYSRPGFALIWDFGSGMTAEPTALQLGAGNSRATFPAALTLQYSDDAIVWLTDRTVNGIAYPGDLTLTPPGAEGGSDDPSYAAVSLLLNGNGTNGATTALDASPIPKVMTANGNAQISTAVSKFGGASMKFDGSGDSFTTPAHPDFDLGSGDFTIEAWMYFNAAGDWGLCATADNRFALTGDANRWVMRANGGNVFVLGWTPATGTWYHIAVCREGTTTRLFVNGTLLGSGTSVNMTGHTDLAFRVGMGFSTYCLNGYIDDFRWTKGVARYTATFTPPADELQGGGSADNQFQYIALATHADGANGSTSIVEVSPNTKVLTCVGNAQISTAQSKFGGASLKFDGSGDYVSTPTHPDFNFGTGDFTVEMWLRFDATGDMGVFSSAASGSLDFAFVGAEMRIGRYQTAWDASASFTRSTGVWYHAAWCRSGTSLRFFIDGALLATATNSIAYNAAGLVALGSSPSDRYFNGYMDDVRITKGFARYTAAFTAPTEDFFGAPGVFLPLLPSNVWRSAVRPQTIGGTVFAGASAYGTPRVLTYFDVYHGGIGIIYGTVKEKNTPANTPLRRRVLLVDERSQTTIRETWSDAATGNYEFRGVRQDLKYTVLAFDHTGAYRATVGDGQIAEVLA